MLLYWAKAFILKRKTQKALVVARKEIGLEVYANKTKNLVISRYQIAGRSANTD